MNIQTSRDRLERRLFTHRHINPLTNCWEWTRHRNHDGYGSITVVRTNGAQLSTRVHRIAAMLWLDFDIYSKLKVCHHCDNPPCFNPNHLFIGTMQENRTDSLIKNRDLKTRRITSDTAYHIIYLLNQGETYNSIAKALDITPSIPESIQRGLTWKHLSKGLLFTYQRGTSITYTISKKQMDLFWEMYNTGYTRKEITKQTSLKRTVINRILRGRILISPTEP